MFHKILVAIDHTSKGRYVFDHALSMAKDLAANLVLVNVLSPGEEESPNMPRLFGQGLHPGGLNQSVVEIYEELWQAYAERRLELLRSLTCEAIAAGVQTEFVQQIGSPGWVICELARQLDVSLIIVGRRGRSGLNELILGSVSNYVLHHAPCSVLTVQNQTVQNQTPVAKSVTSEQQPVAVNPNP
jgi:nucleotide-binding universal stress UspA family protein